MCLKILSVISLGCITKSDCNDITKPLDTFYKNNSAVLFQIIFRCILTFVTYELTIGPLATSLSWKTVHCISGCSILLSTCSHLYLFLDLCCSTLNLYFALWVFWDGWQFVINIFHNLISVSDIFPIYFRFKHWNPLGTPVLI